MKKYFLMFTLGMLPATFFAQAPAGWYQTYTGKVGNMDAVLHLVSSSGYEGYIWFKQNQYPVAMTGVASTGDSIQLGSMDGVLGITLRGTISENKISGEAEIDIYTDNQPGKKASFLLRPDTAYTPFSEFYSNTDAKLPERLRNESTFSYFKGTVWPKNKSVLSLSLENVITQALSLKSTDNVAGQIKAEGQAAGRGWIADNNKLSPKDAAEMGLSLSVETQDYVNVMFEDKKVMTLAHFSFGYTGGAHGNYGTALYTMSKKTGKIIKLKDIMTDAGIARLPAILEQVARIQFKVKSGALKDNGFLVDKIPVAKEMYITGAGIGFLYNPYDIMPFSAGQVNLLVPLNAVKPYLKSEFNSL